MHDHEPNQSSELAIDHDHDHDHTHEHHHHEGVGHNHAVMHDHLHSHMRGDSASERAEELKTLSTAFIDGFRGAKDKTSYLRLAQIPFHQHGSDGLKMHLVDASIVSNWQIGTASPAFASPELVYMPYPGALVSERETMTFTYVSMSERADIDLSELLQQINMKTTST